MTVRHTLCSRAVKTPMVVPMYALASFHERKEWQDARTVKSLALVENHDLLEGPQRQRRGNDGNEEQVDGVEDVLRQGA